MKRIYNKVAALAFVFASATISLTSCSSVDLPESPSASAATVQGLSYEVQGRNVELRWTLPTGRDIKNIQVLYGGNVVAELPSTATAYTVKRPKAEVEHTYTVRVVYTDGIVSYGENIGFAVEGVPAKAAFYIADKDAASYNDDDETAALEWFKTTYASNGEVITFDNLDDIDPDVYSMVWIHVDRKAIGHGYNNLPDGLRDPKAVEAFTHYLKEGGNLMLTKHATQYLVPLGRIPSAYAPGIFGDGDGGNGGDIWTMNAWMGNAMASGGYDRRGHAIFAGMEKGIYNDYPHETLPLIGPGTREDHNCMWDFNAFGFTGSPDVVKNWEDATSSTVLAVWGHVQDFCVGGIIEFNATADYAGRVLANGLAAYEFSQNSGANPYQSNIEKLTENCINYLK